MCGKGPGREPGVGSVNVLRPGLAGWLTLPLAWLLTAGSAAALPAADPAAAASTREEDVIIEGSTQGRVDGVAVGVGNIWEDEYLLADGTRRSSPSTGLWMGGYFAGRVGPGSVIAIGAGRWEVVAVEPDGRGRVRLRRVADP